MKILKFVFVVNAAFTLLAGGFVAGSTNRKTKFAQTWYNPFTVLDR